MKRFEVYRVNLEPTVGREIKKTRPCLIVSPDEMNDILGTIIIAPLTTKIREYPNRVLCEFRGEKGQVALDHIKSIDKARALKKLGVLERHAQLQVLRSLAQMFAP